MAGLMQDPQDGGRPGGCSGRRTNLLGFWLLGLFNNFAYVIMLSAAHDLLTEPGPTKNSTVTLDTWVTSSTTRNCNILSTGTILLADSVPAILVKAVVPFLLLGINIKILLVALLSGASFLLVSFSSSHLVLYSGVVSASLSSSLGEASLLAHTHHFPSQPVLPAWASGTGASGVLGAGSYATLTGLGLGPRITLLLMLWVPGGLAWAFWGLLKTPGGPVGQREERTPLLQDELGEVDVEQTIPLHPLTMWEKMNLVQGLFKYMIPLGLVYFFEYLTNQVANVEGT